MARIPPDLSKEKNEKVYTVDPDEEGLRLDVFLKKRIPWRSRQHLKERIRLRFVTVNDAAAKAAQTVKAGDEVWVELVRIGDPYDPADIPLPILYEDDVIVAIDKPAGFVVHPVGRHQMNTIINALHLRYRRPEDPERDIVPKLAHRLDQYTSGVLLVAKRDDVRSELGRQFAMREVKKQYLALVVGKPDPESGEVEAPIGSNPDQPNGLPMVVRDDGEPSLTSYEVEREFAEHCLLRLRPMSGRTHQIRVHAKWLGTPLVGDPMYGDGQPLVVDGEVLIARYPLHSAEISFRHPTKDEPITIRAPLPEDMKTAIARLTAS